MSHKYCGLIAMDTYILGPRLGPWVATKPKGKDICHGQIVYIVKEVGMKNEASPESVRSVIHPVVRLSIRYIIL